MVNFLADGSEIFRFNRKHDIFATRMRYMNTIYLRYDMFASRTWFESVNFRRAEIFLLTHVPLCGTYRTVGISCETYRINAVDISRALRRGRNTGKPIFRTLNKRFALSYSPPRFTRRGRGRCPYLQIQNYRISTKSLYGRAITCICPQKN